MKKNTKKKLNSMLITTILSLTFLAACFASIGTIATPIANEVDDNPTLETAANTYDIYINEIFSGDPYDWVEIINRGPDRDLTGWSIQLFRESYISSSYVYNFTNGFVIERDSIVFITEQSGTDNATVLHTGFNIWWTNGYENMASLLDADGNSVDHVQWNGWTAPNPPDAVWTGELWCQETDTIYRVSDYDSDTADDWVNVTDPEGTPGELNPNQRFSQTFTEELTGPVAIFRDETPWEYQGIVNVTADILEAHAIPYTVYGSSHMGLVDLSMFQKVVILSAQPQSFYDKLESHVSWFEDYADEGGILEVHAATVMGMWEGEFLLPGGVDGTYGSTNDVSINLPFHPTLVNPNNITGAELDEWTQSTHGYFSTYPNNAKKVLDYENTTNPVFLEIPYGTGYILTTYQPLEWGYNKSYSLLLENVLLYCPIQPDIRVAILNTVVSPSYDSGTPNNDYQTINDGLVLAGIDATVVTNADILSGALADYDVLVLVDNNPSDIAAAVVRTWAIAGGGIVSFDGSAAFLNWAGILPPEAAGTGGFSTYWTFGSLLSATVVNNSHPVLAGYYDGATVTSTISGDTRYLAGAIFASSSGPYYTPLVKQSLGSNYDYVCAVDPPYAGRAVQIWDQEHWNQPGNQKLILNAIIWAGSRGRRAPTATVAILDSWAEPTYSVGTEHNDYQSLYDGLTIAGIDTIVVNNTEIINGVLTNVDILVLVDNQPDDNASMVVKNWALAGGAILSFDGGICFLNWAGILPSAAEGTNGYGIYWDYDSPHEGVINNIVHPVMAGYRYGDELYCSVEGDALYFANISSTASHYTPLVKAVGSGDDLVCVSTASHAGKVVQIWNQQHWNAEAFQQLILNAITWLASPPSSGGGIPGFPLVLAVCGLVALFGIAFLRQKHTL